MTDEFIDNWGRTSRHTNSIKIHDSERIARLIMQHVFDKTGEGTDWTEWDRIEEDIARWLSSRMTPEQIALEIDNYRTWGG